MSHQEKSYPVMYRSLFFTCGEEAIEWIDGLDDNGADWLVRELDAAGAFPTWGVEYEYIPFGINDRIIEAGEYVINVNAARGYIGVGRWA